MYTYQLVKNSMGGPISMVKRSDGWFIPFAPDNTDYQQYLAWLADGNEPLPAEQ
jgi:hypothetical protein